MTIAKEQVTQAYLTAMVVDIYCRVSGKTQEDNTSLKMQERKCREFAEEHGFIVDMVHVEVGSGFTLDRKKLKLMQERYRSGIIQGVIFWKVSRLARTQEFINYLMVEMKIYKCQVFCVHTPLNEKDDDYQLRLFMETFFAEKERKEIVEKLADARIESIKNGNYATLGKRPRYGYRWLYKRNEKGKIRKVGYEIEEIQAKNVKEVFNMFDKGKPLNAIWRYLNMVDKSRKWDPANIRDMLMDVRYTGKNASVFSSKKPGNGTTHFDEIALPDGTYPQIISEEQFNRVQERLSFYRLDKPTRNKYPERFLLGGMVHCSVCGRRMSAANLIKDKVTRRTAENYNCRRELDHMNSISARILDKEVWKFFEDTAKELPTIRQAIEKELKSDLEIKEYAKIEEQRREHENKIFMFQEDLSEGRVTKDTRAFVYQQIENEQNTIKLLDDKERNRKAIEKEMAEKKRKYTNILAWYEKINAGGQGKPLRPDEKKEFLTKIMGVKVIVCPYEKGKKRWSIAPNEGVDNESSS